MNQLPLQITDSLQLRFGGMRLRKKHMRLTLEFITLGIISEENRLY